MYRFHHPKTQFSKSALHYREGTALAAAHPQAWNNPLCWPPRSIAESALTTDSNGTTLSRCVRTESAPVATSRVLKSGKRGRSTPLCRARMVPPMTFSSKEIEDGAIVIQLISADPQIRFLMFPDFQTQINVEPEGTTECQDLMGMTLHTLHFDGAVRVPGYVNSRSGCVTRETYRFQPAKSLWCRPDPATALGSVRSLIACLRSWNSGRKDQQTDRVNTVARRYAQLGLTLSVAVRASTYDLADYGLTPEHCPRGIQ